MSERNATSSELPLSRKVAKVSRPAGAVQLRGETSVTSGRRGRPSQDDYAKLVGELLRREAFQLDDCAVLAQLPGVKAIARQLNGSVFPDGTAIRTLLDKAALEVEAHSRMQRDLASRRIAAFLNIWYRQRGTAVEVADVLGVSRSHVAHTVQKQAVELVARRFLDLAWRAQASA
jgi:hypothetical protein